MSEQERAHVIDVNINTEMRTSFLDYAMSVIVSRALPDVRNEEDMEKTDNQVEEVNDPEE